MEKLTVEALLCNVRKVLPVRIGSRKGRELRRMAVEENGTLVHWREG